jgi:hypothetical protein
VDKPLHVRVALALGCTPSQDYASKRWLCGDSDDGPACNFCTSGSDSWIPRFDTDWSATGPLIHEYKLGVEPDGNRWNAFTELVHLPTGRVEDEPYGGAWQYEHYVTADSPLKAVCLLLLELYEAGTLNPDRS